MSDAIPEGYLSLGEVYDIHYRARYGVAPTGRPDTGERQTATINEIIESFGSRALEAFVRFPKSSENARLLPESWREQFFADRVFFSPEIVASKDDPWSSFIGRTPFIREKDFAKWSDGTARRFRADDPSRQLNWTYGQAIAWIVFRTSDGVRRFGSSYALQR